MERENIIVVSTDIQSLVGLGTEYLIDENGEIVAKFIDGNLECIGGVLSGDTVVSGFIKTDTLMFIGVALTLIYLFGR
jgi:hypothetical protein